MHLSPYYNHKIKKHTHTHYLLSWKKGGQPLFFDREHVYFLGIHFLEFYAPAFDRFPKGLCVSHGLFSLTVDVVALKYGIFSFEGEVFGRHAREAFDLATEDSRHGIFH